MSKVRPQYHFRRTGTGFDAWYVERLIELSKDLPLRYIDPISIAELRMNHWYSHDDDLPTPLSIIEHVRLISAADLSFPIILDSTGRVMDGMHRICKAVLSGQLTIPALQFEQDPEPDFVDCDPDELPYDA
jgi:hypothetical protein